MVLSLASIPASAQSQLWIRQLGTSALDEARAAATDGSGGVYVSGSTSGGLGGANMGDFDAWLARYDSAGNQLWVRQLGTSFFDFATAAAPDGTGGVHVSGTTLGSLGGPNAGPGFTDAWLARYDSAGNQVWLRQFGTNTADEVSAAAPDGAGGVYLGGATSGSLGGPNAGNSDAWLAHYDSAGNQLWIRQLGTSVYDSASGAAPDGSGGVYVSGRTFGSLGGPNKGNSDAWLALYDSAGNMHWVRQLGTGSDDYAFAAATGGAGGVYVSGSTDGSLGGPNAGVSDAWLAATTAQGTSSGSDSSGRPATTPPPPRR